MLWPKTLSTEFCIPGSNLPLKASTPAWPILAISVVAAVFVVVNHVPNIGEMLCRPERNGSSQLNRPCVTTITLSVTNFCPAVTMVSHDVPKMSWHAVKVRDYFMQRYHPML